ncbi:MAG: Ig-like domain-containing protein [Gemmatimonadota bacterium]|nr:MAG: Ig-like domain-containing protein [Gemmatimonadota bacterium]
MKTIRSGVLIVLGAIVASGLLLGVWIGCEKKGGLGPPVGESHLTIASLTTSLSSIQTGGQTAIITAVVTDSIGDPRQDVVVLFSTTVGSITSPATTDSLGMARATLTSGSASGRAKITASIESEDVSKVVYVQIGAVTSRITVTASELVIYANGASTSLITATVFDSAGLPHPGVAVTFTTTAGQVLQPTGWTGPEGTVTTLLVSAARVTDITATVTAAISAGSTAKGSDPSDAVALPSRKSGGKKGVQARKSQAGSELGVGARGKILSSAFVNVAFIGVTLTTTVDPPQIAADEAEVSTVTVNLRETTTTIPIPNAQIFFGTNLGTIEGGAVTDLSGVATVALTSGSDAGEAHVKVYYGALVDTVFVTITATSDLTMIFQLNANPTTLDANGSSQTVVTATLSDAQNNNPVVGVKINFKTTLGTITSYDTTDAFGLARATLTSARRNGTAVVTASYASLSKVIQIQFKGVSLHVAANPTNLSADGTTASTVVFTLKDAANIPIFGEPCSCSSEIGVLSSDPVSQGSSVFVDTTDVNGEVVAYLKSEQPGIDIVKGEAAGSRDSTEVHFTGYEFTVRPNRSEIKANGDTVTVVAELKNSFGVPEQDAHVRFATTLGRITFSDMTDSEGKARALLTSEYTSGTATISAHATTAEGPVTAETTVLIRSAASDTILLSVDPKVVAVGGGKSGTATLTALVLDGWNPGNPVSNVLVSFTFVENPGNGEYINPGTATTDMSGKAVTSFVSGAIASEFEGIKIIASADGIVFSDTVKLTVAGAPASVAVGYDTDSFTDNENGTYTLSVAAIVADANGNPVVDGTWVYFSSFPNIGVVESPVQTEDGIASSQLSYPASSVGEDITLYAESGGVEGNKSFGLPGPAGNANKVELNILASNILANGLSTTLVDALVTDVFNRPVGGAMVYFEVLDGLGAVTNVAFTVTDPTRDDFGVAHATYTSYASPVDIIVSIRAYVLGAAEDDIIEIFLRGITLETTAYPDSLPADGTSQATITTMVKETVREIPIAFGTVSFGTEMGTIVGSAVTDASGEATTILTSDTRIGMTRVLVSYGETLLDSTFVKFTGHGPSQIVIVSAEPDSIGVMGGGYNESAVFVFEVRDDRGRPISSDNPQQVSFTMNGVPLVNPPGGHVPFLVPESATTDQLARVSTVLNSGSKAGAVEVVASLGAIRSTPVRVAIHGGSPDGDHFSIAAGHVNIAGLIYSGIIDTITAFVGDRYANPVPENTAVYFTTSGGIIEGSAVTDRLGTASVVLISADPRPVDGWVTVTAQTVDGEGQTIEDTMPILFSGSTVISNVTPGTFNIPQGGSQSFQYTVSDRNGNPLTAGTRIRVTATKGLLGGAVDFRLADTQSPLATQFSFVLSDPDATDEAPTEGSTITIEVLTSDVDCPPCPSGDATISISGSID